MSSQPLVPIDAAVSLEDKYRLDCRKALISGRQALVRLPIVQRELDRSRGLNTAGMISGYRGSPLGSYDLELWKVAKLLEKHNILFKPGLNEDLALTALAGAQQLDFVPGRKVDGVFGIWYGKGPGVDRSGDAIKHANLHGVSPHGGILLAFGDDHTGKSSTTAHQSDLTLASWGVPVLYPGSVGEILQFGLAGIAMSRFAGVLVGLKLVNETADGTAIVEFESVPEFLSPDVRLPEGGVHIRRELRAMQEQDARLLRHKLPGTQAFSRANRLDRMAFGSESARFVIATAGKAYADVLAGLAALGIRETIARRLEIGVYKIGLIYPLDPAGLYAATGRAEEVLFIEEKRAHAETQAFQLLYGRAGRLRIAGKSTPDGEPLLPSDLPLDSAQVARAIAERLLATFPAIGDEFPQLIKVVRSSRTPVSTPKTTGPKVGRRPAFCPGCPHNTSTVIPDGSFGGTGIGCHAMVAFHPERHPLPLGHMGAEGAQWIGLAPFVDTPHIFQNLGDGTYSHSGSLAIRAAVQAGVNITYKILLNDAVAMTGGQPVEGHLTAARIVEQVRAEGVARVVVVSDEPEHFGNANPLPRDTELRHRDDLAAVQEVLRRERGVTVIIYEQVCAAEKRRRRKVREYPDPDRRIFINPLVCEGCGDCSLESNCLAIQPLDTELGRKRQIDQSACNKDFSCVKGFCPSFVTVIGGKPRRTVRSDIAGIQDQDLPEPAVPGIDDGFDLLIAGIGGTGVISVSAIVGMAARIEGLGASLYDMTGLSQKGGQVFSHVRLRPIPEEVVPARVGPGQAQLILACDLIAAVQPEVLETIGAGKTFVVGNSDLVTTADFQRQRDLSISPTLLISNLAEASGSEPQLIPAAALSEELLGDSIGANLLMLGYAWQRGRIPLQRASIERAIALNDKAVDASLKAFAAGRSAALEIRTPSARLPSVQEFIGSRIGDLTRYWDARYAERYAKLMALATSSARGIEGAEAFVWAVARSAYKLMAYKDEYEVARLYCDGRFQSALAGAFQDVRSIRIHLAPPFLSSMNSRAGRIRKHAFGRWIMTLFRVLHRLRGLREGPLDIFGRSAERRLERELREAYLARMAKLAVTLSAHNLSDAIALALTPGEVRGFGHVKTGPARSLLARLSAGSQ